MIFVWTCNVNYNTYMYDDCTPISNLPGGGQYILTRYVTDMQNGSLAKFSETIYLDSTENGVTMSSLLPGLRDSFYAETPPDVYQTLCHIAATGRTFGFK